MPQTVEIPVQVLDGRSGMPIPGQRLLVFVGNSSEEAKGHAEHTELTTGKDGGGMLTLHPSETRWVQVMTRIARIVLENVPYHITARQWPPANLFDSADYRTTGFTSTCLANARRGAAWMSWLTA